MSPAPILVPPLAEPAADATEALHDAIAERPRWAIPCRAAADPAPWTSEDEEDAAWAAAECAACPVFDLCEAFGIATRADGVTLAGRRWGKHTAGNLRARGSDTSPATAAGANERENAS